MRTMLSFLAAASLFLSSSPAFAATTADCNNESTAIKRAACVRLHARSNALKKGVDIRTKVKDTVDLLRQVRINRRSGNSSAVIKRTRDTLIERRSHVLKERHSRLQAKRTRAAANTETRQQILRQRIKMQTETNIRQNVLEKDSMRNLSKTLQSQAQKRRQVIKTAQENCADSRGSSTYLQCLRTERAKLLQ